MRSPDYYDPFPVTRADAKDAAEWHQRAGEQGKDKWTAGFIFGLLVFGGLWALMTVIPWIMAEISTGSGGGAAASIPAVLWFAMASARGRVRDGVERARAAVAADVVDNVGEVLPLRSGDNEVDAIGCEPAGDGHPDTAHVAGEDSSVQGGASGGRDKDVSQRPRIGFPRHPT